MAVLFCPFCRESFDDAEVCPEHGLQLVAFLALAPYAPPEDEDSYLSWADPRYGRAWLALGALILAVAFVLPFAKTSGGLVADSSLYSLATHRAKTLWMVPACSFALFAILLRNRTRKRLRAARMAVVWLAAMPAVLAGMRLSGTYEAAAALSRRLGDPVAVHPQAGVILVGLALAVLLTACTKLGEAPRRAIRVQEVH